MCGIAGAIGVPDAAGTVRDGLVSLEYRGYDSCGISWQAPAAPSLDVVRAVGPVAGLAVPLGAEAARLALGHTRWATHGGVTVENAHPHLGCDGISSVVHNGVLLNHASLRRDLEARGHRFASDTDSEALVHLWEESRGRPWPQRLAALREALSGTYSVALLDASDGAVYVTKQRNPLWVARDDAGGVHLASDPVALRRHAEEAVSLEDGDCGRLAPGTWQLLDAHLRPVDREALPIAHLDDRTDKSGYEHFMLKEVHETPMAVNRLLAAHVHQAPPYIDLGLPTRLVRGVRRVLLLGAGTSYHAGILGSLFLQRLAGVPAVARPSPEHKDDVDVPEPRTLVVALSQSGETLDTLQSLHRLASHPHTTVAATNHPTSAIARLSDHVLRLRSGQEVSVAATKTFLSQSVLLYLLALHKAQVDSVRGDAAIAHAARNLLRLPRALERVILRSASFQSLARELALFDDVFVLGKGMLMPTALEAALKLKEIAYQHAEAYPAGELKHGPFALLTERTAVLFLLPQGQHLAALQNSLAEVQARGAPVFAVASDGVSVDAHHVRVPDVEEDLQPFVFAQAVHLLSYWVAKARGLPIDRPRNLAKSVTVE